MKFDKKEYMKEYNKEYSKKYKDKIKKYIKKYSKKYRQRPEVKLRVREYIKEYRKKPEVKEKAKEYQQRPEVKKRMKEYQKEYYTKNKNEILKKQKDNGKEYYKKNKDNGKEYYKRNKIKFGFKEGRRKYMKKWKERNKHKISINDKQRRKIDEKWAIKERVRSNFNTAIKTYSTIGKVMSTNKYLDMKAIIKKLTPFPDLSLYEVDHIIPLVKFNHDDIEQVKKAWLPSNLQWLPMEINRWKKDRLIKPMTEEQKAKLLKKLQKK